MRIPKPYLLRLPAVFTYLLVFCTLRAFFASSGSSVASEPPAGATFTVCVADCEGVVASFMETGLTMTPLRW